MPQVSVERAISPSVISPIVGLGRSIIAVAQASVFVFSSIESLIVPVGGSNLQESCETLYGRVSLFCVIPSHQISAIISVVVLLIVASGILPRYTCLIHAYISVSFVAVLSLPDGGDLIATNVAILLVFVYIGDPRLWHWGGIGSRSGIFRGVSVGAQFALRVQMAFIYFDSATAKFAVETWADGSQLYYVSRQEMFGASGLIGELSRALTSVPFMTFAMSWGAVVIELTIAVMLLVPRLNAARVAILLAAALHIAIILMIGLVSFGLIMIGGVVCAAASSVGTTRDLFPRRSRKD